jgi:hypothetical protein
MAELARTARPWLFFTLRQPMMATRTPTAYLGLSYSHGISTTACRADAKRDRYKKAQAASKRGEKDKMMQVEAMASFLLPRKYSLCPILSSSYT